MEEKKKYSGNASAFKALVKRYSEITIEEIEKAEESVPKRSRLFWTYGDTIACYLTKYGSSDCTLCAAVSGPSGCERCHWTIKAGEGCGTHETYNNIGYAKDKHELLAAFKDRAKYMKQFI